MRSRPAPASPAIDAAAAIGDQAQRTFDGKVVLFGNLHAHSHLSDDITPFDPDLSPAKAFAYARDHGLDFLAITDHQKATDTNPRYTVTPTEYDSKLRSVAQSFNAAHPGFVAIPGLEWGTTKTGNHVNILGPGTVPPDSIKDAEYDELFGWGKGNAGFFQFNHPNSWSSDSNRNKAVGNFGEALYSSTDEFVQDADPIVATVSIISTVSGGHITGKHRDSEAKTHREMQWEGHYRRLLNYGFHISPAANQDTHGPNFGTVTAARTAVWADSPTYDAVIEGFRRNRVYASEDDELAVVLQVKQAGQTFWMGDTVPIAGDEADVTLDVRVWQVPGSDGDPTDEGPYTVIVKSDPDGSGGQQAAERLTKEHVAANQTVSIPFMVSDGEYLYLEVREEGGKDNLVGDGEDVVRNGTDDHGADGLRDETNDSAWTSPIWFARPVVDAAPVDLTAVPQGRFVWSTSSAFYHRPDCPIVALIGRGRLRAGDPPSSMQRHACPED